MLAVALTIAGSDPSGGAGIQADLKTFHAFGVYGQAVITLITVQNTVAVKRVEPLAADLVRAQIDAVVADMPPQAAKIGALGTVEIAEAVASAARSFVFPLVLDPVMISKHGSPLISPDGAEALKKTLIPLAYLVTPNLPEAEAMAGRQIETEDDVEYACRRILDLGCKAVLLKGGHRDGEPVDVLHTLDRMTKFRGSRVQSPHTHGTGCTLSAAITAGIGLGFDLKESVSRAKLFVQAAIEQAPRLGHGHGPVNHLIARDLYLE
jgi:hydroxymethylpyrimidine/phosphomethylpyrimidine kinase